MRRLRLIADSGLKILGEPGAVALGWRATIRSRMEPSKRWTRPILAHQHLGRAAAAQHPRRSKPQHIDAANAILTRARYPNGDLETVQWG